MPWIYLLIASACEVAWAIGLKYTDGLTRPWPTVWTVAMMIASYVFLAQAVRTIPVGTGYAIWTGIGAAGTAILGMILLGESRDAVRLACIGLILVAIAGLKWSSPG